MMTQNKIQGKFYPLTPQMGEKLRQANLTAAEWRLWSYLVEIDSFGDRYCDLPDTLTVMEICGIKKTTFYKAIAKFQALELFDFQDKGFSLRNLGFPQKRKVVRKSGNPSEKTESCSQKRKVVRKSGNPSEKTESQPPEPLPNQDSGSSQTLQTYLDFKQTLSNSEREKFFEFVQQQIENLPKPVNDLEAWLAHDNGAGQPRWQVYYQNFLNTQKTEKLSPQQHRPLRDEIEQRRREMKEELRKEAEAKSSSKKEGSYFTLNQPSDDQNQPNNPAKSTYPSSSPSEPDLPFNSTNNKENSDSPPTPSSQFSSPLTYCPSEKRTEKLAPNIEPNVLLSNDRKNQPLDPNSE